MMPATADLDTRDHLVLSHLGLVKATAQRLARRLPDQGDVRHLIGGGVLGLIDAAGRYRPDLRVPFDAYARRRVQGAMLDSLRELDWAPRSLRKLNRDLDATIVALRRDLGREPEEREIAEALDLSADAYAGLLEQLRGLELCTLRQLDHTTPDGTSLLELCIDPAEGPDLQVERSELKQHLVNALTLLPARERQILALYYEQDLTLAEIGEVIGVSESRVSQLRSQALARLRASLSPSLGLKGAA